MNTLLLKRTVLAAAAAITASSLYAAPVTDTTSKIAAATPTIGHPGTPLVVPFDFAKSDLKLRNASEAECAAIAQEMAHNPGAKLQIDGFADSIGPSRINQEISEERALALRRHFVQHYGVSANRIVVRAHGENLPIAGNDTPDGRQQNRVAVAQVLLG